jgi:hypothetical protein
MLLNEYYYSSRVRKMFKVIAVDKDPDIEVAITCKTLVVTLKT